MFQVLTQTNIDFMGLRKLSLAFSTLVIAASIAVLFIHGMNLGIEFKGGTEIQLKFPQTPDLARIRSDLGAAGLENLQVTRIGDPADNEIYIRVGLTAGAAGEVAVARVLDTLRPEQFKDLVAVGMIDLNANSQSDVAAKLLSVPGMTEPDAEALARNILERRKEVALFSSVEDLAAIDGMTPEALEFLRKQAVVGPFALRSQSFIGPTIGAELLQKATWAILGSLAGMLIYIWIRFQFQWGLAAVLALAHDTVITLGLFSLFDKEMSLPVVAAFLSLIGYSVNDTVVVFDRIRETMRMKGSTLSFTEVVNLSINRTLSRTIITSGLTWVVVLALFLFGGETLNPFAFVLVVGVVVGTYSSIFIASPLLVLGHSFGKRRTARSGFGEAVRRTAKKVPSAR